MSVIYITIFENRDFLPRLERQTAVRGDHRAGVASVSVAEPSGFRVVLCLCAERIHEGHGLPLSRLGAKMPAAHAQLDWISHLQAGAYRAWCAELLRG
jgi:hypothetical protein